LTETQRRKRLGADTFPLLGEGFDELDAAVSRAWYGKKHILNWLNSAHEPTLWPAIVDQRPYPVKALVLQHHNPVGASANAAAAAAALAHPNLELLVVQDLFLTASSSLADYLLPAAHWLEKPFLSMGLGLLGFAGDYVECKPAPVAPVHRQPSDYDFWRDLGRRLGQADDWPETIEAFWDRCLEPAGLHFAGVSSRTGPIVGAEARARAAAEPGATGAVKAFGTPSGKIELRSSLMERWGENPLPDYLRPGLVEAHRDRFPLTLTTGGRRIEGFHQDAQQMPWYRRKFPKPLVSMHPHTAKQANIQEGDWVWVETPLGRVRQCARLTEDLQRAVIHADRWWYPERADDLDDPFGWRTTNINVCTEGAPDQCDPVLGTWLLRGLPCRIEKDTGSIDSEATS
jgi:anaerobic selenocysteine-containing dehydrogenase